MSGSSEMAKNLGLAVTKPRLRLPDSCVYLLSVLVGINVLVKSL